MPTPRLYKTEAIVLRQRKLGEADRILTLLTPSYGKLDAKAKSVRKTTSRMSGHLQPLNVIAVQLAHGRTLDVVAGCETVESFHALREGLEGLSRGLYAAELADRFLPERVEALTTYRLLLDTLHRLQGAANVDLALRYYEMRLLDLSGFKPELYACAGCGEALKPESNFFSPTAGGVYCGRCGAGPDGPSSGGGAGTRPLSLNALKVLRALQKESYKDIERLEVPAALAQEIERHLRSYIVSMLERDVNSAGFIERLRREQGPLVEV